jgi:hypothetical protein
MARYREAVAGSAGEQLASAIANLTVAKYMVGTLGPEGVTPEGELMRVPRDYPPDHPQGDPLRYKSLIGAVPFDRPAGPSSDGGTRTSHNRGSLNGCQLQRSSSADRALEETTLRVNSEPATAT